MLTINYVNLIQVSLLTVALLGVVVLWQEKAYRYICALLVLVIIASVFNLLEELGITRHIHLVISHPDHERLITRILFKGDPLLAEMEYPELAIALEEGRHGDEKALFGTAQIVMSN